MIKKWCIKFGASKKREKKYFMKQRLKSMLLIAISMGLIITPHINDVQAAATPRLPKTVQDKNIAHFIPNGYKLFEQITGDLNNDGYADKVLIIKDSKPDMMVTDEYTGELIDRNRRGIIILFYSHDTDKQPDTGYEFVTQNLDGFLSENEDGGVYIPPDLMVAIDDNNLKIDYGHGRYGWWGYTYRFDGKHDFDLIGYDASNDYGPIIQTIYSVNFLTKKFKVLENPDKATQDYEIADYIETWGRFDLDRLVKLSEVESFISPAVVERIDGEIYNQIKSE